MSRRHPTTRVPAAGLRNLLSTKLDALTSRVESARRGHVRSIHQARVASRRLREAVPVIGISAGEPMCRQVARDLRRITRALGGVREMDVALAVLDETLAAGPEMAEGIAATRAGAQEERARHLPIMRRALRHAAVAETVGAVRGLGASIQPDDQEWRRVLSARIRQRAGGLHASIEAAGVLYDSHALHAVRIAAKKCRYTLELAGDLQAAPVARPLARLRRLQESLGRLHDLDVLIALARGAAARGPRSVTDSASTLVGRLEQECRAIHARYLSERPRLIAAADAAIAEIAPRVERLRAGNVTATTAFEVRIA